MQIVLLSGGSGKRLWPLSNDIRAKQFIKILKGADGQSESMVQRVMKQILRVDKDNRITISTSKAQEEILKEQLGNDITISAEPCRRNTFPAIALTAAYLHDVKGVDENEAIVVSPVDPYVDDSFFASFKDMAALLKTDEVSLILLGIHPTYPSEKYGYIIPKSMNKVSEVSEFKEKPDSKTAQNYIEQGALWNGGVFAFKLKYVLRKAEELLKSSSYSELLKNYDSLPNISFDYAVVENEPKIKVIRYAGEWKDAGTWDILTDIMNTTVIGKAQLNETCHNTHVINETELPVIAVGLENIVVVVSPDGILISDKKSSDGIKPLVENI